MTLFLLICNSFLILFAIFFSFRKNYRNHIALIYMIIIQIFYLMFTPWYNYFDNDYTAFNTLLSRFDFNFGLFLLLIHFSFFYLGYLIFELNKSKPILKEIEPLNLSFGPKVSKYYFLFLCVIAFNALSGEISLYDILVGKEESETLGFKGATNYFSSLADSLIILFLMSIYFKSKKIYNIIFMTLSVVLFLILGFRYRLLLLVVGIVLVYIKTNIKSGREILKLSSLSFIFFFIFMFFSENRINFYSQNYTNLVINPLEFNYSSIRDNTQGSIVDFAIYKILREDNASYDLGESMFVYPIIMVTPSKFFKNSEKPYPAPQITTIDNALKVPRSYGQACTLLGMSFFAYSYIGVIFFSFLFGICISAWEINKVNNLKFFFNVCFLLASFQLYTRGYLGLFLLPLVYMLLVVFIIKYKLVFSKSMK
jgi:hypothetical protein